ncbi:MAG: D-2-hydroxyacid dehydrogenase [Bacteroides sp.]|nr:D-2-hydroxyacid dehydrogenase [Bacteroides sp.]
MKIVVTDADTVTQGDLSFKGLEALGDVEYYGLTAENEVGERVRDADIVLCNKTPLNRDNLKDAKGLKYIGLFATGYNNIDIPYCKERGIAVCNAPSYSTDSVAQLVFAFILELTNRVYAYKGLVDRGDWVKSRTFSMFPIPTMELRGKTLGIIGLGSIGQRVAEIGNAFGMRVIAYNRSKRSVNGVCLADLDTVLGESDILTLHCPLNKESENLINSETIARMKDGAILINTARGGVVSEEDAARALRSGKLFGMGTDVLRTEPMTESCPLFGIENCIITPHIAWASKETRERLMGIVEDNLKGFIEGNIKNNVAV